MSFQGSPISISQVIPQMPKGYQENRERKDHIQQNPFRWHPFTFIHEEIKRTSKVGEIVLGTSSNMMFKRSLVYIHQRFLHLLEMDSRNKRDQHQKQNSVLYLLYIYIKIQRGKIK